MNFSYTLSHILNPVSETEFMNHIWGEKYYHIPGYAEKFRDIFNWAQLNNILQSHRLDWPRIRLFKDGTPLPKENFIRYIRDRKDVLTPQLLSTEIQKALQDKATLIVDAVDEMCPSVTSLALNLEKVFHERVQVNSYSAWNESKGFNAHWDTHDVFVLQIYGRKHWTIYDSSEDAPLHFPETEHCPLTPIWESVLTQGDVLYIPRGCWHKAEAVEGETLHLTVGINKRTGIDLMGWIISRLHEEPFFRKDLPRCKSTEEQIAYILKVKKELASVIEKITLDDFFCDSNAKAPIRPYFSLPNNITISDAQINPNQLFRKRSPRPWVIRNNTENGNIVILSDRKEYEFHQAIVFILEKFNNGETLSISDSYTLVKTKNDYASMSSLFKKFTTEGLVLAVSD